MKADKDIDKKIRGMQRAQSKKHSRRARRKTHARFNTNPNEASDSEPDADMIHRKSRIDGESGKESNRIRSEKSGCAKVYDSPPNRATQQHHSQYET